MVDAIQSQDTNGIIADAKPIINLAKGTNGNVDINLVVGDTYTDPGVESIVDDIDKLDKANVTKTYEYYNGTTITDVQSVNTAQNGVYYVTYSITDSGNNTGSAIRVVTVNNTQTLPTISLVGSNNMSIEQYANYTEPGVTVTNNNKVVTLGQVESTKPGVYTVKYIVIDSENNMNSVTRTVTVTEAQKSLLTSRIFADNTTIKTISDPNTELRQAATTSAQSGLYSMNVTNGYGGSNGTTYFFRGDVKNNVVEFAGKIWRIVRINEDGTIRLILDTSIDSNAYAFNTSHNNYSYMYYSNSSVPSTLETWYNANIGNNSGYASKIANGNYFCEAARVKENSSATSGSAAMTVYSSYTSDLECQTDGNGKGLISNNIGLLTYDEVNLAGGYYNADNQSYYLNKGVSAVNNYNWWTMSPSGFSTTNPANASSEWRVDGVGGVYIYGVFGTIRLRPVINLKADTVVTKRPYNSTYPYIYVVENDVLEPVSFATDSWDTIVSNVRKGNTSVYEPTTNGVNNQVLREVNMGSLGTHYLRVANTTPCTTETSTTGCGFVIEFADIITTHNINTTNTNVGGYPSSSMFTYLTTDVYNALPQEIKNIIIPTTVVSGHGSTSGETNFTTSNQKLYLLSRQEIVGDNGTNDTAYGTTRQLDYYYKNSGNSNRIKNYQGTPTEWWTRAAHGANTVHFYRIGSVGDIDSSGTENLFGISPAFRIG